MLPLILLFVLFAAFCEDHTFFVAVYEALNVSDLADFGNLPGFATQVVRLWVYARHQSGLACDERQVDSYL